LIIFDASALVGAALKADSVPERALVRAEEIDVFALSAAVDGEIAGVLNRPKFARAIPLARASGSWKYCARVPSGLSRPCG
jgi:hypothetical protein